MMNPFQRRSGAVPAGSAGPPTPRFGAPAAAPKPQTAPAARGPQTTTPAGPPRPQGYQWPSPPQRKVPGAPPGPRPFPASAPTPPVVQQTSGGTAPAGYTGAPTNPGAGPAQAARLPGPPPQLPQLSFAQWQMKYAQPWMHQPQDYRSPAAGPAAEIPQVGKGDNAAAQTNIDPRTAWVEQQMSGDQYGNLADRQRRAALERDWMQRNPQEARQLGVAQNAARLAEVYGGIENVPANALRQAGINRYQLEANWNRYDFGA